MRGALSFWSSFTVSLYVATTAKDSNTSSSGAGKLIFVAWEKVVLTTVQDFILFDPTRAQPGPFRRELIFTL